MFSYCLYRVKMTYMRVYIAYKYTNIKNKSELKINLEHVTQLIEGMGHETFLLNRDVKAWGKRHVSTIKNVFIIIKNIIRSNIIFAYVNSNVMSKGIIIEFILAKILGKKIILAIEKSMVAKNNFLVKLANTLIEFDGIKDLEKKVDKAF